MIEHIGKHVPMPSSHVVSYDKYRRNYFGTTNLMFLGCSKWLLSQMSQMS